MAYLEADLELNGFQEVALLGLQRVLQELRDVGTDTGDCDLYTWRSATELIEQQEALLAAAGRGLLIYG